MPDPKRQLHFGAFLRAPGSHFGYDPTGVTQR